MAICGDCWRRRLRSGWKDSVVPLAAASAPPDRALHNPLPNNPRPHLALAQPASGDLSRRRCVAARSEEALAAASGTTHFRFLGNEVIVFHVLDNDEINFPFDALTEFTDSESKQQALVAPQAARQEYLREFDQFFGAYRKGCADLGVDYKVMNTNSNLELA